MTGSASTLSRERAMLRPYSGVGPPSAWPRLTAAVLGVLLALLAGVVAGQVFSGVGWWPAVLAAALLPPAVTLGVGAVRGPLLGGLAGLGALALLLALGIAPGRALVTGGRRLLTGALPLVASGPEVAAVAAVVGAAAVLAAVAAMSARCPLLVAAPGLVALAAALAVSAQTGAPPGVLIAGSALCVGGLVMLSGPALTRPLRSAAALALVGAGAVIALGGADLPGAGAHERTDARTFVSEPVRVREDTSPLARVAGLLAAPGQALLRVSGDNPRRLRIATLDVFVGDRWTTSATAVRAGTELPAAPDAGPRLVRNRVRIEIVDPEPFAFLPTPGRAAEVSIGGLGVVVATGDLIVPAGRDVPGGYEVVGTEADLAGVSLPSARAARTAPLDVPPELRSEAQRRATGATDIARLGALADFLASGRLAAPEEVVGGSGVFQVRALLADRRGSSEQYASAFAVLAGALGYDTRLVVGMRVPDGGGVVTSDAVEVWPEVRFERLGWLPFSPTPGDGREVAAPPAGAPEEAVRRAVEQAGEAPAPAAVPAPQRSPSPPPAVGPPRAAAQDARARLLAGAVTVAAVACVVAVPLLKARRRHRRRGAATPAARVLGAWAEAVDGLRAAGVPTTAASTPADVRRTAPAGLDADLAHLAALADRAAWSPLPILSSDADAAWQDVERVHAALCAGRGRLQRVAAAVDPRALVPVGGLRRGAGSTA